jgi:hypothetical protein
MKKIECRNVNWPANGCSRYSIKFSWCCYNFSIFDPLALLKSCLKAIYWGVGRGVSIHGRPMVAISEDAILNSRTDPPWNIKLLCGWVTPFHVTACLGLVDTVEPCVSLLSLHNSTLTHLQTARKAKRSLSTGLWNCCWPFAILTVNGYST